MAKIQKVWLAIFLAMFFIPELLWSPVENFWFEQEIKSKKEFNIEADYEEGKTTVSGKDKNGKINQKIDGLVLLKIFTNQVWLSSIVCSTQKS